MINRSVIWLPGYGIAIAAGQRRTLVAPQYLCLYSSEHALSSINFLESIVPRDGYKPELLNVDLTQIKGITAAAALILFAQVSYLKIFSGYPDIVRVIPPRDPIQKRNFFSSGLRNALSKGASSGLDQLLTSGSAFSTSANAAHANEHTQQMVRERNPGIRGDVMAAATELMLNVWHHAYDFPGGQYVVTRTGRRFWQYVVCENNSLDYLIYDRGQGIPTTLDEIYPSDESGGEPVEIELMAPGANRAAYRDFIRISNAFMPGVSRSPKGGRGNGSIRIKRPVESTSSAIDFDGRLSDNLLGLNYLFVLSGEGRYLYYGKEPQHDDCSWRGMCGTLVEISVPMNGIKD